MEKEIRDLTPKKKTWLYLVGQIILWWYFHLVFRMKVEGAELSLIHICGGKWQLRL